MANTGQEKQPRRRQQQQQQQQQQYDDAGTSVAAAQGERSETPLPQTDPANAATPVIGSAAATGGTGEMSRGMKRKLLRKPIVGHSSASGKFVPKFKFSRFFYAESWMQATRNATSTFLQHPYNEVLARSRKTEQTRGELQIDSEKVLVIQPGSSWLRIGRATDGMPVTIPFVIARKFASSPVDGAPSANDTAVSAEDEAAVAAARAGMEDYFKLRMKNSAFRLTLGAVQQVQSFNAQSQKSVIPTLNDPFQVDWLNISAADASAPSYVVGQRAMEIPSIITDWSDRPADPHYRLYYPIRYGTINSAQYSSRAVWSNDVEIILRHAIVHELGIPLAELKEYGVVLVLPDIHERVMVDELMCIVYNGLNMRGVLVGPESTMASMGAGMSTACVVDIGATKTAVSIVENGECIDCAVCMYGGDDVTHFLTGLMRENQFPERDLDIVRKPWHWGLMNEIKEKWCTCHEAEIGVQLYDFYVRNPLRPTDKYQLKVYSEAYLASLCYFFPAVIPVARKLREMKAHSELLETFERLEDHAGRPVTDEVALDHTTSITTRLRYIDRYLAPPKSEPGEEAAEAASPTPASAALADKTRTLSDYARACVGQPLDTVIHRLIATTRTEERMKKLYATVLLVGGASKTAGFGTKCLQERLAQHLPSNIQTVNVTPPPREVDPSMVSWKGGSILCRLDCAQEMWVYPEEFEAYGGASLSMKGIVNW
ncbi:actin-like protein arp8 [Sorochytrium milnesiophthora]